jgi:putative heme degradation protein
LLRVRAADLRDQDGQDHYDELLAKFEETSDRTSDDLQPPASDTVGTANDAVTVTLSSEVVDADDLDVADARQLVEELLDRRGLARSRRTIRLRGRAGVTVQLSQLLDCREPSPG